MAGSLSETTAKLPLDPETGEMVSKNELKKRTQKRAKKLAAAEARVRAVVDATSASNGTVPIPHPVQSDPDSMFKQGFLADVYGLRPSKDVITRFPPEPNGYLHIGHAKAMAVNFGFAKYHGGKTILRFDDTNPDAEEEEYFTTIEENIRWLGFKPNAITYSSDNFQKLYDLAEKLICLGNAYVCHCGKEEIQKQRGGKDGKEFPRHRCRHADQDVETNLRKFRAMRDGQYEPQTAFLRMKQNIESGNPQMWDLAAYRIPKKQTPHFRTGTEWKIYPTYDFAHCLCDSFKGITHSLCTTEFVLSRESYDWLNHTLGVYEPMQREYGRLNISGNIISKRSLKLLVEGKFVRDWDDPRLFTLNALRRRGIPPAAILSFINELGVTTAKTIVQIPRFEQSVRQYLETTVPRLMLLLDPIPVILEDLGNLEGQEVDIPFSPKDPEMGNHKLRLTKTVYIDRTDFREVDSPGYYRLAPGKAVGLLQMPYPIQATSFSKDAETGLVTKVRAVLVREGKRPRTYIQWVPEGSRRVEVRIHDPLFQSEDPSTAEGSFLNDINPSSETIHSSALIESGFDEVRRRSPWPAAAGEEDGQPVGPESVRFQAMRVAYFAIDSDSTDDHIVLNRIVSLKEDATKRM